MPRKRFQRLTLAASSLGIPLAVLLALSSACLAQVLLAPGFSGGADSTLGPTQTDHLTGLVLDSVTGQPVPRVLVTAPGRRFAALTDYQGRFQFDLVRPEQSAAASVNQNTLDLAFQLTRPGYLTRASLAFVPFYASSTSTGTVELRITPAALITGRVQIASGDLPPQQSVLLYHRQVQDGVAQWLQVQAAQLNSRGEFRFAGLSPGAYKLSSPGYSPPAGISGRVERTIQPGTHARPLQLPASSVQGLLPAFFPNADTLETAAILRLHAGETATANLTLHAAPLYHVVIPVNMPDLPRATTPGAGLSGLNGVRAVILPFEAGFSFAWQSQSHALSAFLPSGSYQVHLLTNGPALASGAVDLQVNGAPVTTAPVTIQPAVKVPIFVRWDSASSAAIQPNSFSFAVMALDSGSLATTDAQRPQSYSDGSARSTTLTEGLFRFIFNGAGYVASAVSGTTDLLREPLHVSSGESPPPIQVTFRDDPASLQVRVLDTALTSPSHATDTTSILLPEKVHAIFCIPLDQPGRQALVQFAVTSTVSSRGSSFSNLAPGRYLLLASDQDQFFPTQPEYRNPDVLPGLISKGIVVSLAAGEQRLVQVPLLPQEDE